MARLYGELSRHFPTGEVCVSTVACREGQNETSAGVEAAESPRVERMPFSFRDARRAANVIRWARWSSRQVRTRHVTMLHVGNLRPPGYVAAWLNLRFGTPYLLFVHGLDLYKEVRKCRRSWVKRFRARLIFGRAMAVVANSRHTAATARALLAELGIDGPERVLVVHPGTDPDRFRPRIDGARELRSGLDPDADPVVLSVARLVPRKGIDTALEAVALLVPSFPRLLYVVAGSGPDQERLERRAAALGITSRVRFLGDVPEDTLPRLYSAADVFVLLAREEQEHDEVEGFGIVYTEAAAAGLPVVAADTGGVSDAVRGDETGILVPPADSVAAAHALRRLLEDPDLRREMGANGRRLVETYYNWDRAAREVWDIGLAP